MQCITGTLSVTVTELKTFRTYHDTYEVFIRHRVIADTVNFDHIKRQYYMSHPHINPTRIVPVGPKLDFLLSDLD
jgi:glutathionyl-hydroquinone reductase